MPYLVIMLVVAIAGVTRLWIHQRRQHAYLHSVEGFRASLEKMNPYNGKVHARRSSVVPGLRPAPRSSAGRPFRHPTPLDPTRREAAKSRLEARRRAGQSQRKRSKKTRRHVRERSSVHYYDPPPTRYPGTRAAS